MGDMPARSSQFGHVTVKGLRSFEAMFLNLVRTAVAQCQNIKPGLGLVVLNGWAHQDDWDAMSVRVLDGFSDSIKVCAAPARLQQQSANVMMQQVVVEDKV